METTYANYAGTIDKADGGRARWYKATGRRTPFNRLPTPEDIVSAVFFTLDTRDENSANLLDASGMHYRCSVTSASSTGSGPKPRRTS